MSTEIVETPKNTYMRLLKCFLRGEIAAEELQTRYLKRWLGESRPMSEAMFRLLDTTFAEIEGFQADPELLAGLRAEDSMPWRYLDEVELRARLEVRSKELNKLKR